MANPSADAAALLVAGAGAVAGLFWLLGGDNKIKVAETSQVARKQVAELKKRLQSNPVLGFDCEWSTGCSVALLQLSTHDGYCVLFRLCRMDIPAELFALLEDSNILKVGVDPIVDKENLWRDYNMNVEGTFDLRFLAAVTGAKPGSLKNMYKTVLGKNLSKDYQISYWDQEKLEPGQIEYAANDVIAAVELYKKFAQKLSQSNLTELQRRYRDERFIPFRHNELQRMDDGCVLQ